MMHYFFLFAIILNVHLSTSVNPEMEKLILEILETSKKVENNEYLISHLPAEVQDEILHLLNQMKGGKCTGWSLDLQYQILRSHFRGIMPDFHMAEKCSDIDVTIRSYILYTATIVKMISSLIKNIYDAKKSDQLSLLKLVTPNMALHYFSNFLPLPNDVEDYFVSKYKWHKDVFFEYPLQPKRDSTYSSSCGNEPIKIEVIKSFVDNLRFEQKK